MKRNKLWLALLPLTSQISAAELVGKVANTNQSVYFEGAKVTIVENQQSQVTDNKGRFNFKSLDNGTYTLKVEYLGSEPKIEKVIVGSDKNDIVITIGEDVTNLENQLVIGQTATQASSLNKQKNADHTMSVLSADAIGQLPDQNVTEALQRVAGVSITRDQGEGRFIVVRGMDPNFNSIAINGISVPSAEADQRQVAMDVIPSDLIEEISVSKSARADKDGDAMGGSIDVKSLSGFDRGGQTFNLRVQGSHNNLVGKTSPKISSNYTNLFSVGEGQENLALAISASWFDREFGSDNMETDGGWDRFDLPDGSEAVLPLESETRDYTINRERLGVAVNLDYQNSPEHLIFLRTLYSDFEDKERRYKNEFKWEDSDILSHSGNSYNFDRLKTDRELKSRLETQTITSVVFGGEFEGDEWDIDYSIGYSKAQEEEPGRIDATFKDKVDDFSLNIPGGMTQIISVPAGAVDAANYELDEIEISDNLTEDKETSFQLDFKKNMLWNNSSGYIKFGLKQRNREKFNDVNLTVYDGFGADYTIADFLGSPIDHFVSNFGPTINESAFRNFALNNRSSFDEDTDTTFIESASTDYIIDEDVTAAYLMAKSEFGNTRVVGGVRLEKTNFDAVGQRVTLSNISEQEITITPINVSNDYSEVLPSINITHEVSDKLIVRAAASRSLVRPNFKHSAPVELIEIEEDDGVIERKAEIGNPYLEPMTSNNFDFGIEYYPGNIGVFSAGVFYKDIDNFVVLADVSGTGEYTDFDEAIQPLNGESADLLGIELNYVQQLSFLPDPFDGFLISANYTYVDSSAKLAFRTDKIPLPRQSDNVANFAVGYEKGPWSLRAAWTYRDAYFTEATELDDPEFDIYVDDHLQFDVSAKYLYSDRIQFYLEGINLNNEPRYTYYGNPSRNAQFEEYGWTAQAGIRMFFY
ncbi:MAG: TonB-dependent receptor [Gammaproteobacteria bacterium]